MVRRGRHGHEDTLDCRRAACGRSRVTGGAPPSLTRCMVPSAARLRRAQHRRRAVRCTPDGSRAHLRRARRRVRRLGERRGLRRPPPSRARSHRAAGRRFGARGRRRHRPDHAPAGQPWARPQARRHAHADRDAGRPASEEPAPHSARASRSISPGSRRSTASLGWPSAPTTCSRTSRRRRRSPASSSATPSPSGSGAKGWRRARTPTALAPA